MKNIFKKNIFKKDKNKEDVELFKEWLYMDQEDVKSKIKEQRTEDLKAILKLCRTCTLVGIGLVIGLIITELTKRV